MAEQYAYRNKNDGNEYLFDAPRPDLDAQDNFERIDPGEVPQAARDALDRARAERKSIEDAAKTRAQRVEATSNEEAAAAAVLGTSVGQETPVMTGAHLAPIGVNPAEGVLSRNRPQHPSRQDLEEKAARDSHELATTGVLSRAQRRVDQPPTLDNQTGGEPTSPGVPGTVSGEPDNTPDKTESPDADAGQATSPDGEPDPDSQPDNEPEPPAKSALKPEWQAYAKDVENRRGDRRQRTDEEIDGMTVKELQDAYAGPRQD